MGHLINPVAFRLGWSKNWVDSFYIDNLYYPQFMHLILRLRLYLLYFFRQPNMRKFAYFFSHFNIRCGTKGLIIDIFYYDGRLENDWDEFINSFFSSRMRNDFKVFDRFVFQRFYLLLLLLLLINSLVMSRVATKGFVEHFLKPRHYFKLHHNSFSFKRALPLSLKTRVKTFSNNVKKLKHSSYHKTQARFFKRLRSSPTPGSAFKSRRKNSFTKASFILFTRLLRNYFISYLRHNSNYGKRRWSRATWDYLGFGQSLFYIALTYFLSRPFFHHIGRFLEFSLMRLSNFSSVKTNFFLLSNTHITAGFLASYIGKRLRQGYQLTELINPLRRELSRVKRASQSRFRNLVEKATKPGIALRMNYASVFSGALFFLFKSYRQCNGLFYITKNTFVNYESFLMLFFVGRQLFANSYKQFFDSSFESVHFTGLIYNFYVYQPHFLFFYKTSRANLYGTYLFLPLLFPNSFSLTTYPDYYFFLREMTDTFGSGFSLMEGAASFSFATKNISAYPIYKAVAIGFTSFLRYLRFDMAKFNLALYYNLLGINKKKLRSLGAYPGSGLLGFKFHLKGRFTRKQIAASHIFRKGSLPLSTVTASIDYAFNTVPLKNSAVGIKIWLYKANRFHTFFFKVI